MRRTRKPKEYPTENIEWGESATDKKFYTPTSEAIRNLVLSGDNPGGEDVYDFQDGKDDGRALPIWRQEGVDRAEMSQAMMDIEDEMAEIKENERAAGELESKRAARKAEAKATQVEAIKEAMEATKTEPKA